MEEQVQQIPEVVIEQLQKAFLHKKVVVFDSKGRRWVGMCNFVGLNPFILSWGLQVTINRTPINNVQIKDIMLFDNLEDPRTI